MAQSDWPEDIDVEVVPLLDQMNRFPGIRTLESCFGHGKMPPMIWFRADDLRDLPPLLYFFDVCHSGVKGWSVVAYTDCAMCPTTFRAQGSTLGAQADREILAISRCMQEYLDDAVD